MNLIKKKLKLAKLCIWRTYFLWERHIIRRFDLLLLEDWWPKFLVLAVVTKFSNWHWYITWNTNIQARLDSPLTRTIQHTKKVPQVDRLSHYFSLFLLKIRHESREKNFAPLSSMPMTLHYALMILRSSKLS